MARLAGLIIAAVLVLCAGYLAFWPVAVDPVAWTAPPPNTASGLFATDDSLSRAKKLPLEGPSGPVAAAKAPDGDLFIATVDGKILKLDAQTADVAAFADTKGLPLDLEFSGERLLIADAMRGLLAADMDGTISAVSARDDEGRQLGLITGLAAGEDGAIYLSEAASRRAGGADDLIGMAEAAILEHRGTGRVLSLDPATGTARPVAENLNFPAGLAFTANFHRLLIAETGSYRVLAVTPGERDRPGAGTLMSSLPGFPANIDRASDGTFWLGLVAERSSLLDRLSSRPYLRKVLARLPAWLRPGAGRSGQLVHFDEDGNILETLKDASGKTGYTTGAVEGPENLLFVTSLASERIAVLPR